MHPCLSAPTGIGAMPNDWYALYARHQHEKLAAQILTNKGFEVLLPLYQSISRWSDRRKTILRPLFSNYLFIRADLERKADVLRTVGVCSFVCNAGVPTAIWTHEVKLIRKLVENPSHSQPHCSPEPGEPVRVIRGPFAGLTGTLQQVRNQYRVVVSLELLHKCAALEIDISCLERVGPATSRSERRYAS